MMSAFDIHNNLIALLGALALAVLLSATPPASAEDLGPSDTWPQSGPDTPETYDFVFGDGEMDELRELLGTPNLSAAQRRLLQRTLDTLHEESA